VIGPPFISIGRQANSFAVWGANLSTLLWNILGGILSLPTEMDVNTSYRRSLFVQYIQYVPKRERTACFSAQYPQLTFQSASAGKATRFGNCFFLSARHSKAFFFNGQSCSVTFHSHRWAASQLVPKNLNAKFSILSRKKVHVYESE
jgi:hypothetical protein